MPPDSGIIHQWLLSFVIAVGILPIVTLALLCVTITNPITIIINRNIIDISVEVDSAARVALVCYIFVGVLRERVSRRFCQRCTRCAR